MIPLNHTILTMPLSASWAETLLLFGRFLVAFSLVTAALAATHSLHVLAFVPNTIPRMVRVTVIGLASTLIFFSAVGIINFALVIATHPYRPVVPTVYLLLTNFLTAIPIFFLSAVLIVLSTWSKARHKKEELRRKGKSYASNR